MTSEDEAGDDQRGNEIEQRNEADIDPARQLARRAAHAAAPAIIRPICFSGVSGAHSPVMLAGAHDQHAVGKPSDLIELDGDQEHRLAAVAHVDRAACG